MMKISGATRVFAVLGDPITHSLSPVMHNVWLAQTRENAVYVALRASEASLVNFGALGLAGANVTAPLKAVALRAAQVLSDEAELLGAANVLWRRADGVWCGDNTDGAGFVQGLDQALPNWRANRQTALVLGAGGAGKAIALGLARAGIKRVLLANRSPERAVAAAAALGVRAIAWETAAEAARGVDLLVNATHFDTPWAALAPIISAAPASAIASDAVYRPRLTPFLLAAQQKGMACVDGLFMLAGQGALAFERWFGIVPDQTLARAQMLRALTQEGAP